MYIEIMNADVKVAFDVDSTLILPDKEGGDIPNYPVIAVFNSLQALGCQMFIWSGGGLQYAKRWAEKLGLKATIVEKGSFQPDLAFDDMDLDFRKSERSLGLVNIQV